MALRLSNARRYGLFMASNDQSFRKKYMFLWNRLNTDPLLAEWDWARFHHMFCADPNFYGYYIAAALGMGVNFAIILRLIMFNPEVYFRRQEKYKNYPDRHRQFSYSVPYYNHHWRNFTSQFRMSLIDNEPDYIDQHPWGLRPERKQAHYRLHGFFSVPYFFTDPIHFKLSYKARQKFHEDQNYVKKFYEMNYE